MKLMPSLNRLECKGIPTSVDRMKEQKKGEPLSLQQIRKLLVMSEEGYSRPQIAKEVGCSKAVVYEYQKRYALI